MKYVYLLRSISRPSQRYVGMTDNLRTRPDKHNPADHLTHQDSDRAKSLRQSGSMMIQRPRLLNAGSAKYLL